MAYSNEVAKRSRQILVTELPLTLSTEELELFFESRKYCPLGGFIERVEMIPGTRSAVITFEQQTGRNPTTRSPPIDGTKRNAAPINLKIIEAIAPNLSSYPGRAGGRTETLLEPAK